MGSIIEISIFMLVIAAAAFAPLGYFIWKYTKNSEPFADFEHKPEHHSIIDDLAEKATNAIQKH